MSKPGVIFILILTGVAHAAEPDAGVAALIEQLKAEDFDQRIAAEKALLRKGAAVVAPLKQALAREKNNDFRGRASGIVDFYEGGGTIDNGIKIKLTADRESLKPGEKLQLTTTLYNTTDAELNVYIGWKHTADSIMDEHLRLALRVQREDKRVEEFEVGAEATPVYSGLWESKFIFVTLPPFSRVSYKTIAELQSFDFDETESPALRRHIYRFGGYNLFVPAADHRLRMVMRVTKKVLAYSNEKDVRGVDGGKPNRDASFWIGTVRSNDVLVRVK